MQVRVFDVASGVQELYARKVVLATGIQVSLWMIGWIDRDGLIVIYEAWLV